MTPWLVILSIVTGSAVSCHNTPCATSGIVQGERFSITVNAPPAGTCSDSPIVVLAPGDSFTLTAGDAVLDITGMCTVIGAAPVVPSFAADIFASCSEGHQSSLAIECHGAPDLRCNVGEAIIQFAPNIPAGTSTIEYGTLSFLWSNNTCHPGGCYESYDVRIDRLSCD